MTSEEFESTQRKAQRQLKARHLVSLGSKLVELFELRRPPGVYQLVTPHNVWAQTTETLKSLAYRLPHEPKDWEGAHWERKPVTQDTLPLGMHTSSTMLPLWLYAQVADKLRLPKKYRDLPLWLPHFPDLAVRFLKDHQLALMGQLVAQPATLEELKAQHPEHGDRLECDLMALVWSGHLQVLPDD